MKPKLDPFTLRFLADEKARESAQGKRIAESIEPSAKELRYRWDLRVRGLKLEAARLRNLATRAERASRRRA